MLEFLCAQPKRSEVLPYFCGLLTRLNVIIGQDELSVPSGESVLCAKAAFVFFEFFDRQARALNPRVV